MVDAHQKGEPMEKSRAIEILKPLANSFVDYANITMKEEDDDTAEALEMAIDALKAQLSQEGTTSDLISRQQAIDALQKCRKHCIDPFDSYHIDIQDAEYQLSKLPTIQPEVLACGNGELVAQAEPHWIPVSERLPEEYGNYLISIHGEDEPDIGTINPNDKRGWSLCDANGFYWAGDKKLIVTAWMPLPSPYQKGATT